MTPLKKYFTWQRILASAGLLFLIGLGQNGFLRAQTVTEGFNSDQTLQRGMLVKINKEDPNKVEAVSESVAAESYGVVIGANDSPITLSEEGQSYFVATVGVYEALVSTQQGPITKGDYIAVSSIDGIGMHANASDETVVGIALSDFDGSKNIVSTPKLKKSDGSEEQLAVGRVSMDIKTRQNPSFKAPEPDVPTVLRNFSRTVAGKEVSAFRAYTAVFVFLLTGSIAASLLYGGVRTGMISIGRNPFGKKSITRAMFQVIISGLIIFIVGLIGVYLILRL